MARPLIHYLFLLTFHTVLCSSEYSCLTWKIHQERLLLICRNIRFSHPVSLIDNQGTLYAKCRFRGITHDCTPIERKDLIVVDYARKNIVFTTAKLDENMNGVWVCLQENLRLTTQVSFSKGIIDSTDILITGNSFNSKHILNCFSCREPDGNNVEFLVNGRTEDSITYNYETGKCTRHKEECPPWECNCTDNVYMRVFQFDVKSNEILYSCDMLFTDSFTQAKFELFASVAFNGTGFYNKSTSLSIIKPAVRIWNRTFTFEQEKEHIPEIYSTRNTPVTDHSDTNSVGNAGIPIHIVIGTLLVLIVGCILVICFVIWYYKRKLSRLRHIVTDKDIEPKETKPLTSDGETMELKPSTSESVIYTDEETKEPKPSTSEQNKIFGCRGVISLFCGSCHRLSKNSSAIRVCITCVELLCVNCFDDHSTTMNHHHCISISNIIKN